MQTPTISDIKVPVKDAQEITNKKLPIASPVTDRFKRFVGVVDANILPIAAWFAIAGLAVRGAMTLLAHTSPDIQMTIAILVVAFLAFKLR